MDLPRQGWTQMGSVGRGHGEGEGRGGREGDPARSPHLSVPDLLSHRSASFPDTVLKQPYL